MQVRLGTWGLICLCGGFTRTLNATKHCGLQCIRWGLWFGIKFYLPQYQNNQSFVSTLYSCKPKWTILTCCFGLNFDISLVPCISNEVECCSWMDGYHQVL
nr:hypothetical protein Iba_chr13fCG2030 [Ipomoea batatas]